MPEKLHYSESFDGSLSTFNWNLVDQAAEKERLEEYPLSRIAQVFNRGIKEGNYKIGESDKRGKYVEGDVFVNTYFSGPNFPTIGRNKNDESQMVEIRSVKLPKNYEFLKEIDEGFEIFKKNIDEQLDKLEISKKIGTAILYFSGLNHMFRDANGRTSVALCAYIIERYSNTKFDAEFFASQPHSFYMALGGVGLLPEGYDVDSLIEEGSHRIVDTANMDETQRSVYLEEFIKNEKKLLDCFDWKTGSFDENKLKAEIRGADFFLSGYDELLKLVGKSSRVEV